MEVVLKGNRLNGRKCNVLRKLNYHIKGEETGGACGTCARAEKCIQNIG
jgi:hypothetical protein